jgi:hypothetical protein
MAEISDRGGTNEPVLIIRGRNANKVIGLAILTFMLAGYTNVYPTTLFSFDTATRAPVDILASLIVTSAFVFWTVKAFMAKVELYDDRVVYRGSQRHRVLPIAAIDCLCEDNGTPMFLFLGNDRHYVILGTSDFHKLDIDRVCEFVKQKAHEQGRSLATEARGFAWLMKKQYSRWPPDYLFIICTAALTWLLFFS